EQLAAPHLAQAPEHRQQGGQRQQIADRHPAHLVERGLELDGERGQCELDDAGVELCNEGTSTSDTYDQPWIPGLPGYERQRRGLHQARRSAVGAHFNPFRMRRIRPTRNHCLCAATAFKQWLGCDCLFSGRRSRTASITEIGPRWPRGGAEHGPTRELHSLTQEASAAITRAFRSGLKDRVRCRAAVRSPARACCPATTSAMPTTRPA